MNSQKKMVSSIIISLSLIYLGLSCSKSSTSTPAPTLVKEWNLVLDTKFENPSPAGRTETGTVKLQLYSDNTMKYTIVVNGLAAGDNLIAAHIHWGDALTNGPVVLSFSPTFTGGNASGTVPISSTLIDSINTGDSYVNVHTTQKPAGLARGQLNDPVDFAVDVTMVGANENPAVTTNATGLALLRLGSSKNLYCKITVTGLEANDTLSVAHIHGPAPAGTNAGVLQGLCSNNADFGTIKKIALSDANITALKTAQVYVNAHSKLHPGGIIRGQIR